ncbi:hypothetical protein B0F90DRAFT_1808688 [Multifurca ochricompacta]|uniref:EF-hand domain-containing protein n=1 Tax=Multifurca ochricompacta TaxID=376703 RepID=A0AAD4M7S5_9AGAM|nr:hypothetical protein B0F90DRAFT_1808688 [Multifurca ochricompacta]
MSTAKRPEHDTVEEEKSLFDGNDDLDGATSLSYHDRMPLSRDPTITHTYLQHGTSLSDPAQTRATPSDREGLPSTGHQHPSDPNQNRGIFEGVRKFGQAYEQFDSRNASEQHLAFADGDLPKSKFFRLYQFLLNASIVTRWTLFIVPILIILWIPGVLSVTMSPKGEIWGVRLIWWSIWLTIFWCGMMLLPRIVRHTVGVVAVGARRYIDWLGALHRYVALFSWSLIIWIAWNPLIDSRQDAHASTRSVQIINFIGRLLFGIYLCAALLLFEKFSIQWIAGKFHERSYAERIADQKFAIKTLTTLYRNSTELPENPDEPRDSQAEKRLVLNSRRLVKQALKGVRFAATTTTTALGNVASEIAGSSVLQPNSPQAIVQTALESASKTKLLARRIFFSFRKPGRDYIVFQDISRFFPSIDEADSAFVLFDRDGNGDVTLEETEQACWEFHREQLSIEHSMQDLDSAVGRLDNLLMSVYVIIATLIIAVTLVGTLYYACIEYSYTDPLSHRVCAVGLSWLIGSTLGNVLTCIIFLFVLHPFDVGDRVNLGEKGSYTVKEIRLLCTIFLDNHGTYVQVSNAVLNGLVQYSTTFEQIEKLRSLMLGFVQGERRDFQPLFDISVVDIPDQEKMTLKAEIMYKSNWQHGSLKGKAIRRNKWVCALKLYLAEAKIYGPKGDPSATSAPTQYTLVPWEQAQESEPNSTSPVASHTMPHMPSGGYNLTSRSAAMHSPPAKTGRTNVGDVDACRPAAAAAAITARRD